MINLNETKLNNDLTIYTTKIEDGSFNFTGVYETIALLSNGDELGCVRCNNHCDAVVNHDKMVQKFGHLYIREEAC